MKTSVKIGVGIGGHADSALSMLRSAPASSAERAPSTLIYRTGMITAL